MAWKTGWAGSTLALGLLLSLLVYSGIRRGLAPLTRLTAQLEHRSVNALSPIGMTQAPSEVHALVQAVNGLPNEVALSVNQEKRFINDAAHQLREAMTNLIDNALRYTPRGSTITLRVQTLPQGALLAVEDNGPGLSDDDMAHAFKRFWRASEQLGGCGLGLAIVQEIARRHGAIHYRIKAQPSARAAPIKAGDWADVITQTGSSLR
jgi:K+-sensing histidine kinase KdpD